MGQAAGTAGVMIRYQSQVAVFRGTTFPYSHVALVALTALVYYIAVSDQERVPARR